MQAGTCQPAGPVSAQSSHHAPLLTATQKHDCGSESVTPTPSNIRSMPLHQVCTTTFSVYAVEFLVKSCAELNAALSPLMVLKQRELLHIMQLWRPGWCCNGTVWLRLNAALEC